MENITTDLTFWAICINAFITTLCFSVIKFNDFKHLSEDVQKISINVEKMNSKVINIDKKVAVQEQRIDDLEK